VDFKVFRKTLKILIKAEITQAREQLEAPSGGEVQQNREPCGPIQARGPADQAAR